MTGSRHTDRRADRSTINPQSRRRTSVPLFYCGTMVSQGTLRAKTSATKENTLVFRATLLEASVNVARRVRRALRPARRFRGAFANYDEAMASVRSGAIGGYNHAALTGVSRDLMSRVALEDYPGYPLAERNT